MPVEIRETKVTPAASGSVVQLYISDAPPDDESTTFVLRVLAKLPAYQAPVLAQLQRAVMKVAQNELTPLLQSLAAELKRSNHPIDPSPVRTPQVQYGEENWEGPEE
jgi:hypothetical protein